MADATSGSSRPSSQKSATRAQKTNNTATSMPKPLRGGLSGNELRSGSSLNANSPLSMAAHRNEGAPRGSRGFGSSHRGGSRRTPLDITPNYEQYWDQERIDAGITARTVVCGSFHLLPNTRRSVGFVRLKDGSSDIFVEGLEPRNRAMDGDYVAVELGPEIDKFVSSATVSSSVQLQIAEVDLAKESADDLWAPIVESSGVVTSATTSIDKTAPLATKQRTGRVVAVMAANQESTASASRESIAQFVGRLQAACDSKLLQKGNHLPSSEAFAFFIPSDTRVPKMRIPRGELPYEFTQDPLVHGEKYLYTARIASWPAEQQDPTGQIFGRLGQAGEINAETAALLMENGVDHGEFPQDALDCLKEFLPPREVGFDKPAELWWKIPSDELAKRRDLRETLIFTIDPYTAKDIDDALHITPMADGTFEVGVHIADVSHFIKPGSALDKEAVRRATSVYLVQKVIPMLPALLSEELCSLNPNVDRLAFSCIWRMKGNGELCPEHIPWFGRTVIRSACKLHYGLAQQIIDKGPDCEGWDERGRVPEHSKWTKPQVHEALTNLHKVGMARRRLRFDPERGGALEMQTAKMSFELDPDTGNPKGVRRYPMHDTNRLVEEYMLLANFLVAQKLIQGDRTNAFLRHHPPPDAKEMQKMVEVLKRSSGVSLFENGKISPSGIQEALGALRKGNKSAEQADTQDKESSLMIVASELLKKPMNNALYFVASELEESKWRHWALNIRYYTHFTSPIRRYADVCVHRQLGHILLGPAHRVPLSPEDQVLLKFAAEHCNEKKEASRLAQEASDEVYLNLLVRDRFAKKEPLSTRAVIIDLGPRSFTAFIPEFGVSKRVNVQDEFLWTILGVETLEGGLQPPSNNNDRGAHHRGPKATFKQANVPDEGGDEGGRKGNDESENKTVVAIRAAIAKQKVTVELKVLSELRVSLVPKLHKDKRGGLDYKLIPEAGASITNAVPMTADEEIMLTRRYDEVPAATTRIRPPIPSVSSHMPVPITTDSPEAGTTRLTSAANGGRLHVQKHPGAAVSRRPSRPSAPTHKPSNQHTPIVSGVREAHASSTHRPDTRRPRPSGDSTNASSPNHKTTSLKAKPIKPSTPNDSD